MMQKLQRFGAAMFVPVLLFSFAGIVVALGCLFNNATIFGSLASPTTGWYKVWDTISAGGWTVFNQECLLFVVGLPIGLANKSHGRAAMESLITYLTFNYFVGAMLSHWGAFFGVPNFNKITITANATNGGLTQIAGIKTLDTSIIFSLIIAGIVVYLHNHYFDKKLPEWLGTFQGSTFVYILGFFVMIPVAFLTCLIWPKVQLGINSLQHFIVGSGFCWNLDLFILEPCFNSNWTSSLSIYSISVWTSGCRRWASAILVKTYNRICCKHKAFISNCFYGRISTLW